MKKIKIFSLIAVAISLLTACAKNPHICTQPEAKAYINIELTNIAGDNLLETKLYSDSIEIYHIYPCGHTVLDCYHQTGGGIVKNGYRISEDKGFISIDIGDGEAMWSHIDDGQLIAPYEMRSGQVFTTYIKWNSQDTDTIIADFIERKDIVEANLIPKYIDYIISYNKVYYNDSVIVNSYKEALSWYPQCKRRIKIVK